LAYWNEWERLPKPRPFVSITASDYQSVVAPWSLLLLPQISLFLRRRRRRSLRYPERTCPPARALALFVITLQMRPTDRSQIQGRRPPRESSSKVYLRLVLLFELLVKCSNLLLVAPALGSSQLLPRCYVYSGQILA